MLPAQVLAENGVDLGVCDADGCTALHVAAACGRAEAACLLLSLPGADVRAPRRPSAAVAAAGCSLLCDRPRRHAMHKWGSSRLTLHKLPCQDGLSHCSARFCS